MGIIAVVSETTLLCAFDYAVGRMTYVVGEVTADIMDAAPKLSDKAKAYMLKEINRRDEVNALGMQMDKEQWYKVRDILRHG